jgi:hypothetical protein
MFSLPRGPTADASSSSSTPDAVLAMDDRRDDRLPRARLALPPEDAADARRDIAMPPSAKRTPIWVLKAATMITVGAPNTLNTRLRTRVLDGFRLSFQSKCSCFPGNRAASQAFGCQARQGRSARGDGAIWVSFFVWSASLRSTTRNVRWNGFATLFACVFWWCL